MSTRLMSWLGLLLLCLSLLLQACAGSENGGGEGGSAGDSGMGDAPCTECGERGEIKLKISKEKFYREWNEAAYGRLDSTAVVGVLPTLKVTAGRPETCRMCHSYSADALDFDLARIEDSLFVKAFLTNNTKPERWTPNRAASPWLLCFSRRSFFLNNYLTPTWIIFTE